MVYDADRIQQRQQYYHAFAKSNSNSSIPTTIGKESTTSQSKYMKNKLSKSRLEIVNQSCSNDYTGAVPPRPSPRQYSSRVSAETKQDRKNKAGLPTRSLLDDSSSVASRRSRGSGKHEFTFAQEQKSTHSINSDREDSSHHTSETPVKKSGRGEDASEATTQYDNTTLGHQTQRQQQQGYGPESTVGDLSTIKSGTSLASSASSDLCLPLPYSKLPIAKPMFGREDELESLQQYLSEGASVTSLIGVGGVGKSHLAIHASRKWFAQQPFSRFVVWLNAATELTLRASYLEALQQVLMGNIQPEDASQHGEVIIVAELLQRQLRRQRRKEQVRLKRQEQRKKLREAESRNECTQVLSEDTNDPLDRDDTEDVEEEEQEEEIPMDTKALGQLLWDSLLQGVPQEYEWLVVVQNIPGGMGGIKGPAGFKEFFFPIPDTPKEEWNQGRVVLMTRHESYSGKTAMGDINSLLIGRLDEASSVRMMIANAVFNGENEIGQENLASPYKDRILKDAERVADKLVGPHYLDGNPLMMSTAIGHIVTNKMSLREYYNNLKHQVAQALETSGYGNGKVQSSVKRETAMSVCLEQAMDNAHANGLADILSSACFICAEGIPLKLLGDNAQRVQKLCSMNLLNLTGKDMYTMHRVHQRTAVDAIITHVGSSADDGSEVETEEFLCTPDHAVLNLRSVLSSFKPEKASTWRNARSCIVHIEALRIHYDVLERKRYLSSNFNHGYYADIIDSYASIMQWAIKDRHTAIAMYKESLRLRRSLQRKAITDEMNHSTGRNSTKNISSALSQTLASLGGLVDDDTEAKMFYQEALDIYCQVFGNDAITIELMTLYIALADVETKLEDSKRAYGHYKKAIELYFLIYGHNQNIYADDQKLFLAETLQKIGDLTHRQMKNHAEAELYLEGAVSLLRHLYDEGSKSKKEEMATALEALGSICHAQGKMKEARQYYRNALKMKDTIYGDAKWSDISSKCDGLSRDGTGQSAMTGTDHGSCDSDSLASDQDSESGLTMGDSKKPLLAKPSQESGVELIPVDAESRAKALSEKDAKMARTLHRLGVMSWNLGSLQQAEDYFEKTLVLQQKAFGEKAKNEDIAITLFSLGGLCNDLHDDQKKACWYYRRALECYYASYGKEAQNESIAQLLHAMGQSLQAQKEYEEARSCLKKALTMKYVIYGGPKTFNADIVTTLQDLGKVSRDLQATEDARFYYKEALGGLYNLHGKNAINPQISSVMTQLGGLSYCSGLLADAKQYFEKSLAIKYGLYGEDAYNDDLASTLNNLGSLNARQKHYNEAFEYYKLALDQYSHLSKDKENRDNAEVKQHLARTLHNLGLLSFNLQQYQEAKKFYAQSLKIKSQVYKEEPDAPELALTLSKMSSVEVKQGNTDAAKYYQNQALKRSPTFLETHKKLINRHLLPATPEEAAALISMIPPDSPDYMDHEVIARSLDLWEGLRDINSHNRSKLCFGGGSHSYRSASLAGSGGGAAKTCWYPLKNLREKKKKSGKKKTSNVSSNGKQEMQKRDLADT